MVPWPPKICNPFRGRYGILFHSMQEEFIIFVRELVSRVGASLEVVFHSALGYLAAVPLEITIIAGVCSLLLLFRIPFLRSIALVPYLIVRPVLRLFGVGGSTELWSVVYDSKSKYPLDPVYVSIRDMVGKEVASAVTDIKAG